MIKRTIQIVLTAVLILLLQELRAGEGSEKIQMKAENPLRSDVLAAFLVAYEEHLVWWKAKGVNLTPKELTAHHWGIHYSREGPDRIAITFLPESPTIAGGDVEYVVDLKTFRVVERIFGR
jgi:hypothetical protein